MASSEATKRTPKLAGRVVAAGPASRTAMAELLGITRLGGRFEVTAVAWVDHAMEVAVAAGGKPPQVLRIEGRTPESKGLVSTDHLNMFFRGADVSEKLSRTVEKHAKRALEGWNLEKLADLLADDPDLGKPAQAMPPSPDEGDRPRSLLDTWGSGGAYADFFAGGELARGQLDSIDPSRLFRFVQHCDLECLQVNPHTIAPVVSMVNYPWDDRERQEGGFDRDGSTVGDVGSIDGYDEGMVTTDLTEDDVILGNTSKVKDVLDYALSLPNPDNKSIFFSNTCVPAVTGEDVESIVQQAQERTGTKIFYLTVSARSMTTVFEDILVTRRLEAEKKAGPPSPHSVNLIGFPSIRSVRETEQLLRECGVNINAKFLPDLIPETIDQLPNGSLNVLHPNSTWQHHYDQLTFESRTPTITPGAPYGIEGTRRWLNEITGALGMTAPVDEVVERAFAPHAEHWQELRERAAKLRLGIVVRDLETFFLTTPSRTWGVPIIAALEEMGFGLDILLGVSNKKTATERGRELRGLFEDSSRHTLRAFDSFEFLRHRLAEADCDAFLSYHFFDWRVTSAGKPTFSMQQFEMGLPGIIRSLERLLRICSTTFFKRYGRYLARSTEGLRTAPKPTDEAQEKTA